MADRILKVGYGDQAVFARDTLTVSTTAIGLDEGDYDPTSGRPAYCAMIENVGGQAIRYRVGADPAAGAGHKLADGEVLYVHGADNIRALRVIRDTGSDATLEISYLR